MRAVIALGAGVLVAAVLMTAPATPSSDSKYRASLIYRGVTYYGLEGSHLGLRAGQAAGMAREPNCSGVQRLPRVPVRRIVGVRPRVAITRRDVPTLVYIAADRCKGNPAPRVLVRCLRRSR